ncbi:serine protease 1-like [Choristoneura fumiferana]|uniref:serine protease 1-like n=1 Tax=Choristoneura fumiferana TaxID=7141 RepID=UPI003D155275
MKCTSLGVMAVEYIVLITNSLFISIVNSVKLQNLEGYVVEGDYAEMKDFPHAALLYIESIKVENVEDCFICGSSILNQAMVMTAAHCLENCFLKCTVTVHVGNQELPFRASRFILHEEFDTRTIHNDIALVRLKKNLKFGKNVRRVSLMRNPPYHESAKVTGWGYTDEQNRVMANHLMQLSQKIWSRSSCIQAMGKRIPVGTFCGGTMDSLSYVAPGDSGSGIMVRRYIQIGLVSFKNPRISKSLAIYTDVGHYYDWVKKTTKILYCS